MPIFTNRNAKLSPNLHEDVAEISTCSWPRPPKRVLRQSGIGRFHPVGHSIGGLTALLLAHQNPSRVLSFVDIEGNLAPEDCFLSRQVLTNPSGDDARFVSDFTERARRHPPMPAPCSQPACGTRYPPGAVHGIFESMVELSDHGDLMAKFLSLPPPRMFMYGEQKHHYPTWRN